VGTAPHPWGGLRIRAPRHPRRPGGSRALDRIGDAYEVALGYALHREQFGRPIASFQLSQAALVCMALEIRKGVLVALLHWPAQGRRDASARADLLRQANVREAIAICWEARIVLGDNGVTLQYSPGRHASNLESGAHLRGHTVAINDRFMHTQTLIPAALMGI
jgi:alkylation response protein AidB-like acyl-CoA dehydrogenase